MFARLAGLTAVSLAASMGLVLSAFVAASTTLDVRRMRVERQWDWETAPSITRAFDELDAA